MTGVDGGTGAVGRAVRLDAARARLAAAWARRRRLGASDCEEIRSGLVAQPVNAASSLAYVAGGAWVAARGQRAGRPAAVAFGGLLGAVGVGSVLYHGPCPPGAQQAHDTSLAAVLGVVVLHDAASIGGRAGRVPSILQVAAAATAALPVLPRGRHTNAVVAVLGVAALVTEVVVSSRGRPPRHAVLTAGTLAAGAVVNGLSRTGGPLCRPRSLLQGHGAWHVLSAAALTAWARGALLPPPQR